ncbi:Spy/CpxP family protein refolding chaperone [Schlegelella sp. S2-27]|uniref:Spy/CpxP family protein refolding chaperone n=1 Tax=Caldimonas mangrovi TaxID=2944811 RepID=A0ABT0YJF5_9BURK|nr:Spy/CpxP family protein refolding chaperone [Caldimonas mangrovi]
MTNTKTSRRPVKTLIAGLVLGVAAAAAIPVLAHGPRQAAPMGMMGGAGFMGSPERIDRMVEHLLRDLNATDAQRAQVKQIAQAAAADLKTQREASRGLHEQAMQLFTQPTVDANAVEALRQQRMAQMDQSSRRMSQAMIEISRVLTPEQRTQLAERMKQRAERWKERRQRHEGQERRN